MIRRIELRSPEIGNKVYCIQEHGVYVFEEGPGMLVGISCTFAGGGTVAFYDGVPGEDGFFHLPQDQDPDVDHNGRLMWKAHPCMLGMNQLNGGFHHGLTMIGNGSINPTLSVTWMGLRTSKPNASTPLPSKNLNRLLASNIKDVRVPSAPNSLTRSHLLQKDGIYRLARRDCELYTVNPIKTGLNVRVSLYTGEGRTVFSFPAGSPPSLCSDNFPVGGFCEKGLIAEINGGAPLLAVVWREQDQQVL